MYRAEDIARFALLEFERGLDSLTDEEARTRVGKADGTSMNAIAWIVGHIACHWLGLEGRAKPAQIASMMQQFRSGSPADPTPPPLIDVLKLLDDAKHSIDWVTRADDTMMSVVPQGSRNGENIGTMVMRAALHTWFHSGEINAIRQMLGHSEIRFVGPMAGNLEWRSN